VKIEMEIKRLKIPLVAVALAGIMLVVFFASDQPTSSEGLNAEAGILKPDGTIIPLGKHTLFSVWTVNNIPVNPEDIIFLRAWISLKATGLSGRCSGVRFNYWQKWQGQTSSLQFGTEGVPEGNPPTKIIEPWNNVPLPVDAMVTIPLKFRDIVYEPYETPSTPLAFSEYDPYYTWNGHTGCMIRNTRFFFCQELDYEPDGTYTLEFITTVYEIIWEWTEYGQTKTGYITLNPNEIGAVFTITKTTAGLSASLGWEIWG